MLSLIHITISSLLVTLCAGMPNPNPTTESSDLKIGNNTNFQSNAPLLPQINYNFHITELEIDRVRSFRRDTLYIGYAISVASPSGSKYSKWGPHMDVAKIGDWKSNSLYHPGRFQVIVPVADDQIVTFHYLAVNNGHDSEAAVTSNMTAEMSQIANLASGGTEGLLDHLQTLLGAGAMAYGGNWDSLKSFAGSLAKTLWDAITANCDGFVAERTIVMTGAQIKASTQGKVDVHNDLNNGYDSPPGCGDNSIYRMHWEVSR